MGLKNILGSKRNRIIIVISLMIICFLIRLHNSGGLSGGDDSSYAAWFFYAYEQPTRFIYLTIPDLPVWHQGMSLLRNFSIIPLAPFVYLFGFNTASLKLASLIFASLSVMMAYILAKRYFNTGIALLTMILFVFSPLNIAFSRVVFVDSALTFYILLTIYLVVRGIEEKRPGFFYIAGLVCLVDQLTTNFRGLVPLVGLVPFVILSRPSKKQWKHLVLVAILAMSVYIGYTLLPLLWGDSSFILRLFMRINHAEGARGTIFFTSLIQIGKYLYFTPFLGLIVVPALFGIYHVSKDLKRPINALTIFYLLSSIVFYVQGQFYPSRQTIYVPVFALLASIGIISMLKPAKQRMTRLYSLIFFTIGYYLLMVYMMLNHIPETYPFKQTMSSIIGSKAFSIGTYLLIVLTILSIFIPFILRYIGRINKFLVTNEKILLWSGKAILIILLIINIMVPVISVGAGFGIYHRSDKINAIADYLEKNLGDEKYGCIAGIHQKTLTYLLKRQCITYSADIDWLERNKEEGNLKYFVINLEYDRGTLFLGKFLKNGSVDTTDYDNPLIQKNDYQKIAWVFNNTVDITEKTSLGKDNPFFRLREIK